MATTPTSTGFLANLDATAPGWDGVAAPPSCWAPAARPAPSSRRSSSRGVAGIVLVNRTRRARRRAGRPPSAPPLRAAAWGDCARLLGDAGLLVNTTTLGMNGQPPLDIDLAALPADAVVDDIVYVPLETPLLAAAGARGLPVDGLGMLLHQAVPGFARWFGVTPAGDAGAAPLIVAAGYQGRDDLHARPHRLDRHGQVRDRRRCSRRSACRSTTPTPPCTRSIAARPCRSIEAAFPGHVGRRRRRSREARGSACSATRQRCAGSKPSSIRWCARTQRAFLAGAVARRRRCRRARRPAAVRDRRASGDATPSSSSPRRPSAARARAGPARHDRGEIRRDPARSRCRTRKSAARRISLWTPAAALLRRPCRCAISCAPSPAAPDGGAAHLSEACETADE